jgi:hypothetical protein
MKELKNEYVKKPTEKAQMRPTATQSSRYLPFVGSHGFCGTI